MKAIKLEKSKLDSGKFFYVKVSDLIDALTELLTYYSEELVVPYSNVTLKDLLGFAYEGRLIYSGATIAMDIEDFNFLNSLYKNRKSKRETNKT